MAELVIARAPLPTFRSIRVRTNPGIFQFRAGSFVGPLGQAGSRGLVGSTEDSDFEIQATKEGNRLVGTVGGRSINLPDVTGSQGDTQLDTIVITDALVNGVPATGVAYAGRGDFAVYTLFANGNMNDPIYAITGTPTDLNVIVANDNGADIRAYSLTPDPVRPSPLAFFATDFYGQPGNFNASPFFIVEPNQSSLGEIETYYSFVDITETGRNQRSAALVHTFAIFENDASGLPVVTGSRRGSMRPDATLGSFNLRGGLGSVSGPGKLHSLARMQRILL